MSAAMQLIAAFAGSVGFGIVLRLKPERLLPAGLGGGLTWGVYLWMAMVLPSAFAAMLLASAFAAAYALFLARLLRAPATVFTIPALVPLIPGSGLYYTMQYAVAGERDMAVSEAVQTALCALAIAAGTLIVVAAVGTVRKLREKE